MSEIFRLREQIDSGRLAADGGCVPPPEERRRHLKRMRILLAGHRAALDTALREDLGRTAAENERLEYRPLERFIEELEARLPRLAAPKRAFFSDVELIPEPLGQVLIFASWRLPLCATLEPVLAAYAAGNRVVLKLSERSAHTMQLLRWLLTECFTDDEVAAVSDEYSAAGLLAMRFDHIDCRGDSAVVSAALNAAAQQRGSVSHETAAATLCIVAEGAGLEAAARRIVRSKFAGAGQLEYAPDLVLVQSSLKSPLADALAREVTAAFGQHPLDSARCGKIVDLAAYERLSAMAGYGRLICGGEKSPSGLKIAPTVIDRFPDDAPFLRSVIDGPVLPLAEFISEADLLRRAAEVDRLWRAVCCFGGGRAMRDSLVHAVKSRAVVFDAMAESEQFVSVAGEFQTFSRNRRIVVRGVRHLLARAHQILSRRIFRKIRVF